MAVLILVAAAALVWATRRARSLVVRSIPSSVLALGMVAELWMAQLWQQRAAQWEVAYWRDIGAPQRELQQPAQRSRRPESKPQQSEYSAQLRQWFVPKKSPLCAGAHSVPQLVSIQSLCEVALGAHRTGASIHSSHEGDKTCCNIPPIAEATDRSVCLGASVLTAPGSAAYPQALSRPTIPTAFARGCRLKFAGSSAKR